MDTRDTATTKARVVAHAARSGQRYPSESAWCHDVPILSEDHLSDFRHHHLLMCGHIVRSVEEPCASNCDVDKKPEVVQASRPLACFVCNGRQAGHDILRGNIRKSAPASAAALAAQDTCCVDNAEQTMTSNAQCPSFKIAESTFGSRMVLPIRSSNSLGTDFNFNASLTEQNNANVMSALQNHRILINKDYNLRSPRIWQKFGGNSNVSLMAHNFEQTDMDNTPIRPKRRKLPDPVSLGSGVRYSYNKGDEASQAFNSDVLPLVRVDNKEKLASSSSFSPDISLKPMVETRSMNGEAFQSKICARRKLFINPTKPETMPASTLKPLYPISTRPDSLGDGLPSIPINKKPCDDDILSNLSPPNAGSPKIKTEQYNGDVKVESFMDFVSQFDPAYLKNSPNPDYDTFLEPNDSLSLRQEDPDDIKMEFTMDSTGHDPASVTAASESETGESSFPDHSAPIKTEDEFDTDIQSFQDFAEDYNHWYEDLALFPEDSRVPENNDCHGPEGPTFQLPIRPVRLSKPDVDFSLRKV